MKGQQRAALAQHKYRLHVSIYFSRLLHTLSHHSSRWSRWSVRAARQALHAIGGRAQPGTKQLSSAAGNSRRPRPRYSRLGDQSTANGEELIVVVFQDRAVADSDVRDAMLHADFVQAAEGRRL